MERQLYDGKAWADLSPDERNAARERHYVKDITDLPPELRTSAERHQNETVAEIAAQEAAMSPEQLEFIRQQNEKHFNPDGSRKRLAAG